MASENESKNELYEKIKDGIINVFTDENFKNWLNTTSCYYSHYYSMNNAMLIHKQNPNATYLFGYEQWKDLGRQVNKGEKGIKILVPVKAYEKKQGDFLRYVIDSLNKKLDANKSEEIVYHDLNASGSQKIALNRNIPGNYGLVVNGQYRSVLTEEQLGMYIKQRVLNKFVQRYTHATVFDISQCHIPQYLWLKEGKFKKEDLALNEHGKPVRSLRGEYRVKNTDERIKKFTTDIDLSIKPIDADKAEILYQALKNVCEKNGVPVYEVPKVTDPQLASGIKAYFERENDIRNLGKGYIVIPAELSNKTQVIPDFIHEIAHANLHGTEEKANLYDRHVREIHAEAIAYSIASQFGIDIDTKSFIYLASWQQDLDFKELKNNLEVIYNESRRMTNEITTELDRLGYNRDLTKKDNPIMPEHLEKLSQEYVDKTVDVQKRVDEIKYELPKMLIDNKNNPELTAIIKGQAAIVKLQQQDLELIYNKVSELKNAKTRSDQDSILKIMDSTLVRLNQYSLKIDELSNQFIDVASKKQINRVEEFKLKPMTVLRDLAKNYPVLKDLSRMQLAYIARSKYISNNYGKLLDTDPAKFAEIVAKRASKIDSVIAKSNIFIEINYCEQWFNNPIFEAGQLLHPRNAETISRQAEKQIKDMQEATSDYIPYTKCDFTIFDASGKNLLPLTDRMDIGDGYQTSFKDFLSKFSSAKARLITEKWEQAIKETSVKDKIYTEPKAEAIDIPADKENILKNQQSAEEWKSAINNEKQALEQSSDSLERGKSELEAETRNEHNR